METFYFRLDFTESDSSAGSLLWMCSGGHMREWGKHWRRAPELRSVQLKSSLRLIMWRILAFYGTTELPHFGMRLAICMLHYSGIGFGPSSPSWAFLTKGISWEGAYLCTDKSIAVFWSRGARLWRGSEIVPPGLPQLLRSVLREHSSNQFKWRSPHSLVAHMVKNYLQFDPWVGKFPWRRKWIPTPVFLPGEFHGQRSLATVHGVAKLDMTEWLILSYFSLSHSQYATTTWLLFWYLDA